MDLDGKKGEHGVSRGSMKWKRKLNVHEVKNNVEISEQADEAKRCNF